MANPLDRIAASIRLNAGTVPALAQVNANGTLTSALLISQLTDVAQASTTKSGCAIVSGMKQITMPFGLGVSDIMPGMRTSGTGFASGADVLRVAPGVTNKAIRYGTAMSLAFLPPDVVAEEDILVGAAVSGTNVGTAVVGSQRVMATPEFKSFNIQITTSNTSTTVTASSTIMLCPGMLLEATGLPAGCAVVSITDGVSFVVSHAATATATVTALVNGVAHVLSGTLTTTLNSASATVTSSAGPLLYPGMLVVASTVPAGTTISSVNSSTSITLSVSTGVTAGIVTASMVGKDAIVGRKSRNVSFTNGSALVTVDNTEGLVPGQLCKSTNSPANLYIVRIDSATTFTVSANFSSTNSEVMDFGAVVAIATNFQASSNTGVINFGPVVEMGTASTASSTSVSYTWTGNSSTIADMRDGDYCMVAIKCVNVSGYTIYLTASGFVRYSSPSLRQFYLWSAETGGSPITALTVPTGQLFYSMADAPHKVAIFKTRDIMPGTAPTLKLRLKSTPTLSYGARPILPPRVGLTFRLNSTPRLLDEDPANFIIPPRVSLDFGLASAPSLSRVEVDIEPPPAYLALRMASSPRLTGGYIRFHRTAPVRFEVRSRVTDLLSNAETIEATSRLTFRARGRLTGNEQFRRASPVRFLTRGTSSFTMLGRGISVREVITDCLSVWNLRYTPRCCINESAKERAIADLNAALQIIYSQARILEYLSNDKLTVQVSANARQTALPINIQSVHGTARLKATEEATTSKPLFAARSLAEITGYADLVTTNSAEPLAYWIERTVAHEANSTGMAIMLSPVPANTVYVDLQVSRQAPRYSWEDVERCTPLELPATYAESLLMPIVRHRATTFRLFTNQQLLQSIQAQYQKAMLTLGLTDGLPQQSATARTTALTGAEP